MRVEYLGVMGLSWTDKVTDSTKSYLKPVKKAPLVSPKVIDILHKAYLTQIVAGKTPPVYPNGLPDSAAIAIGSAVAKSVTMDLDVVHAFMRSLYELSKSGAISYAKYSPKEYARMEAIRSSLPTEKSKVAPFIKGTLSVYKVAVAAALIGAIGFLVMQGKTFIPKGDN